MVEQLLNKTKSVFYGQTFIKYSIEFLQNDVLSKSYSIA